MWRENIYHPSPAGTEYRDWKWWWWRDWPVPAPRLDHYQHLISEHWATWWRDSLSLQRSGSVSRYWSIKLRPLLHQENVESLKYFSKIHHFLYQLSSLGLLWPRRQKNSTRKVLPQDFYQESVMFWKINLKYWIQINGGYTRLIIHHKPILKLNNMKIILLFLFIRRNFLINLTTSLLPDPIYSNKPWCNILQKYPNSNLNLYKIISKFGTKNLYQPSIKAIILADDSHWNIWKIGQERN